MSKVAFLAFTDFEGAAREPQLGKECRPWSLRKGLAQVLWGPYLSVQITGNSGTVWPLLWGH